MGLRLDTLHHENTTKGGAAQVFGHGEECKALCAAHRKRSTDKQAIIYGYAMKSLDASEDATQKSPLGIGHADRAKSVPGRGL